MLSFTGIRRICVPILCCLSLAVELLPAVASDGAYLIRSLGSFPAEPQMVLSRFENGTLKDLGVVGVENGYNPNGFISAREGQVYVYCADEVSKESPWTLRRYDVQSRAWTVLSSAPADGYAEGLAVASDGGSNLTLKLLPPVRRPEGGFSVLFWNTDGSPITSKMLTDIQVQASTNLSSWFFLDITPYLTNGLGGFNDTY